MWNLLTPRRKKQELHRLLSRLVNEWVAERDLGESDRLATRTDVHLPAMAIPLCEGSLALDVAAPALIVDVSCEGIAVVLYHSFPYGELVVALPDDQGFTYVEGTVRYSQPLVFGFRRLGVELTDVVHATEYPELYAFPKPRHALRRRGLLGVESRRAKEDRRDVPRSTW